MDSLHIIPGIHLDSVDPCNLSDMNINRFVSGKVRLDSLIRVATWYLIKMSIIAWIFQQNIEILFCFISVALTT